MNVNTKRERRFLSFRLMILGKPILRQMILGVPYLRQTGWFSSFQLMILWSIIPTINWTRLNDPSKNSLQSSCLGWWWQGNCPTVMYMWPNKIKSCICGQTKIWIRDEFIFLSNNHQIFHLSHLRKTQAKKGRRKEHLSKWNNQFNK